MERGSQMYVEDMRLVRSQRSPMYRAVVLLRGRTKVVCEEWVLEPEGAKRCQEVQGPEREVAVE